MNHAMVMAMQNVPNRYDSNPGFHCVNKHLLMYKKLNQYFKAFAHIYNVSCIISLNFQKLLEHFSSKFICPLKMHTLLYVYISGNTNYEESYSKILCWRVYELITWLEYCCTWICVETWHVFARKETAKCYPPYH